MHPQGVLQAPAPLLGRLEARLVLDAVQRDGRVLVVVGDNRFDAYGLLSAARARRIEEAAADGVDVVRAFTVHQLATLLVRDLPRHVAAAQPALVLVTGFLDLFLDEDVRPAEARALLARVLRALRALDAPLVVTYAPPRDAVARGLAALVADGLPRIAAPAAEPTPRLESFAEAA